MNSTKKIKIIKFLCGILILAIIFFIYNYFQISQFVVKDIKIKSSKINSSIKITQISDFHSNKYVDLNKLKNEIQIFNPDFIVLTGDIIDDSDMDLITVEKLLKSIKKLNKEIYFVEGNHETRNEIYVDFEKLLRNLDIVVLKDEIKTIVVNNETINIEGVKFYTEKRNVEENGFNLILRHEPNNIEEFLLGHEDLVLSGHTHGGQIRLPIVGAVVAPDAELFPKYDEGLFNIDNSILYIDSGLGNSFLPLRFLNPIQFSNITIEGIK